MKYKTELHNEMWENWSISGLNYMIHYFDCQALQMGKYTRYNICLYVCVRGESIRFYHISG